MAAKGHAAEWGLRAEAKVSVYLELPEIRIAELGTMLAAGRSASQWSGQVAAGVHFLSQSTRPEELT